MTSHWRGTGTSSRSIPDGFTGRRVPKRQRDAGCRRIAANHVLRLGLCRGIVPPPAYAGELAVAEALTFPGAVTYGLDLADARLKMARALEDLSQALLEERRSLFRRMTRPRPDADLMETVLLSLHAGSLRGDTAELLDHLRRRGCCLSREGGRHSIFRGVSAGLRKNP
jgi:hypothetical protein